MRVLGISSALSLLGISIVNDHQVLAEYFTVQSPNQTEDLVKFIDKGLDLAKISLKDIDGISCLQGPGSYGGLRGGMTTAKTLAQVKDLPIIGVSTLETIAYNFVGGQGTAFVVTHACRNDWNVALFSVDKGNLRRLTEDLTVSKERLQEILVQIKGKLFVAGELSKLGDKLKDNIVIGDGLPYPRNVAFLGGEKIKRKETDDYLTLTPYYTHRPTVKEPRCT